MKLFNAICFPHFFFFSYGKKHYILEAYLTEFRGKGSHLSSIQQNKKMLSKIMPAGRHIPTSCT